MTRQREILLDQVERLRRVAEHDVQNAHGRVLSMTQRPSGPMRMCSGECRAGTTRTRDSPERLLTTIIPRSILSVDCIFIETPLFSEVAAFLSDDELRAAQMAIAADPRAGAAIRGTNGARKLRVNIHGRGKSGGARIIYLDNTERCAQVWLLLAYDKKVADNLSAAGRKALSILVRDVKASPCLANPAMLLSNERTAD